MEQNEMESCDEGKNASAATANRELTKQHVLEVTKQGSDAITVKLLDHTDENIKDWDSIKKTVQELSDDTVSVSLDTVVALPDGKDEPMDEDDDTEPTIVKTEPITPPADEKQAPFQHMKSHEPSTCANNDELSSMSVTMCSEISGIKVDRCNKQTSAGDISSGKVTVNNVYMDRWGNKHPEPFPTTASTRIVPTAVVANRSTVEAPSDVCMGRSDDKAASTDNTTITTLTDITVQQRQLILEQQQKELKQQLLQQQNLQQQRLTERLKQPKPAEEKNSCDLCGREFHSSRGIQIHIRRQHECPQCKQKVCLLNDLHVHMREVHNVGKNVNKESTSAIRNSVVENAEKYINIRKGNKEFYCEICKKTFKHLTNMDRHIRTHTGEKPFKCELCGLSFTEAGNLKKHMVRHRGIRPFECGDCGRRFSSMSDMQRHRTHVHDCPIVPRKQVYHCHVCKRRFKFLSTLQYHEAQHAKNISCMLCKETFDDQDVLDKHLESHVSNGDVHQVKV